MFTGIIEGIATLQSTNKLEGYADWEVEFPDGALNGIEIGASISLEGVCLTVTSVSGNKASFQIIEETLGRSTLGKFKPLDTLNYERSLTFCKEVGGHLVSGHIMEVAKIIEISQIKDLESGESTCDMTIQTSDKVAMYIFEKGYIAIDGISLTVGNTHEGGCFEVHIIPETLRRTTLGNKVAGSLVNIEIDSTTQAAVDTVIRLNERLVKR
jgi:riboflavin synthase